MVTEVSVKDLEGCPNVVEVIYGASGRSTPADEFMITEVRERMIKFDSFSKLLEMEMNLIEELIGNLLQSVERGN